MKYFSFFLFVLFVEISPVFAITGSSAQLNIYPAPEGAKRTSDFQLFVNDREVFVYNNPVAAYAYFDFKGVVDVVVKPVVDVKWADVSLQKI